MEGNIKLMREDGLRLDGRSLNEMRPIKIQTGVVDRADGSAFIEWGANKIIVAVYVREAYPKHAQNIDRAIVKARYNMSGYSVEERKRPGPDRRTMEISKVVSEALSSAIVLEKLPRAEIDVFIQVLEADAGTRIASLTASSVAVADAGVPMRDLVVGCTAGKADGKIVLDLSKDEDNFGQADIPMAILPRTGKVVLLQLDGDVTEEEFNEATSMMMDAMPRISELQRNALMSKYSIEDGE
ncbi:exosome complex exonuclease Rrp41 [Ferroplasma acidiphilum]|jgi:exosome complex component RRP41|uniref:Exosome complex exonuclease Rrp41 n=1 Tax=Ferroplasma acidiphilum TaxID=74969 RepID=A0A1V0N1K0_9ARCH|nr:exosome complex exonuclease Rrp41 [Ferroplasma acidiphilum]ARD83975.1 exosome complex exonuclease Rrp41 [Ferroplasma acidiphilum]MCL4348581.1 exosome complex exonuclease Rrp41 [Candidatus Thermoplasmatota archaeon]NOL59744.1 exosome complex exonuclease Rrp41 [Ferroplasma acidiphilum]WMT52876.1 MAG: exosome complex exonuclease Rrp41 [Ferroplasma acidiphilum]